MHQHMASYVRLGSALFGWQAPEPLRPWTCDPTACQSLPKTCTGPAGRNTCSTASAVRSRTHFIGQAVQQLTRARRGAWSTMYPDSNSARLAGTLCSQHQHVSLLKPAEPADSPLNLIYASLVPGPSQQAVARLAMKASIFLEQSSASLSRQGSMAMMLSLKASSVMSERA